MSKQSITEFLANPNVGGYDEEGDFTCGVWYDWFCKDVSLIRRGASLLKKVQAISKSNKFDNDKCYVCLLYTSPSPRDRSVSRMPSSA